MEQSAVRSRSGIWRVGAGLMAAFLLFVLIPRAGASAAVPIADAHVVASATGTVLHAGLIESAGNKLVDGEVAFTGAVYDSTGFAAATFNEMQRKVAPAAVSTLAYSRGVGIEAGLASTPDKTNQVLLAGLAEISAPIGGFTSKQIGPLDVGPLAWANLVRGMAGADARKDRCVIGSDLSASLAYVADAQLLDAGPGSSSTTERNSSSAPAGTSTPLQQAGDTVRSLTSGFTGRLAQAAPEPVAAVIPQPAPAQSTTTKQTTTKQTTTNAAAAPNEGLAAPVIALDSEGPKRAVSQSRSRTLLVGQRSRDGKLMGTDFGVMSEVRQTIAPVTLFKGTSSELTLELLGEWVLQAVATGLPGGAYVHYGPGNVSPSTPVIRILDASGVTDVLTLQDLLGGKGLVIEIPGLAEIAIGEDARAIGGDADSVPRIAGNGTSAAAAVDVVRVKLLQGAPVQLTDLRIGHMEARSSVPAGGVACDIPVSKKPDAESVSVGHTFEVGFRVTNPYDCTLRNVVITDKVDTEGDARFDVVSTTPKTADTPVEPGLVKGTIRWKIGDLAPHTTKKTSAVFRAADGPGVITDEATAAGTVGGCARPGATVGGVDVSATDAVLLGDTPQVDVDVLADTVVAGEHRYRVVPLTGAPIAKLLLISLGLLAAGGAALTLAYRFR